MVRPLSRLVVRLVAAFLALTTLAALVAPGAADAHATPDTAIVLTAENTGLRAEITVPVSELRYAMEVEGTGDPSAIQRDPETAARAIAGRLTLRDDRGAAWLAEFDGADIAEIQGQPDLVADVLFTPPACAPHHRFTLAYDAVIDVVPNHVVLVFADPGGAASADPRLVGALQRGKEELDVNLGLGTGWNGFTAAVGVGVEHILIGFDHLLFIISLMLPAPLLASRGRWIGYGGFSYTTKTLLGVLTAFTIGHSCTLIAGAVLGLRLPAQPVEILIAVSILVTAIHAWRPIFPHREPYIAAFFGLIHGMAFAAIIAEYGADTLHQVSTILGFNIGIELVQIALVASVMPALILFAMSPYYRTVRTTIAALIAIAATFWIVERAFGWPNPIAPALDLLLSHGLWLIIGVDLIAVGMFLLRRTRSSSAAADGLPASG